MNYRPARVYSDVPYMCDVLRGEREGPCVCAHITFDIRETYVNSMLISLPIINLVFSTCLVLHIFDVPRALRECGLAE